MFTTRDAYNTAKRAGSYRKLYDTAADPKLPHHEDAKATLALMAADQRGESNAYGARACVHAAIQGADYATMRHGANETAWT
jgi:hypothetical protein